jgi:hypothetical protein
MAINSLGTTQPLLYSYLLIFSDTQASAKQESPGLANSLLYQLDQRIDIAFVDKTCASVYLQT